MATDLDDLRLQPGSHTHSVARLKIGQTHALAKELATPQRGEMLSLAERIGETKGAMAHAATAVFSRVREKLPDNQYRVTTGVMNAADNRLYVVAVIQRVQ